MGDIKENVDKNREAVALKMDYKNRHVWHQIGIYNKNQNGIRTLYQSEELIRPSVYHQLRQPSEWELMVSLYWRNHGGSWGAQ